MTRKIVERSAKARGLKLVSFEIEPELWTAFRVLAIKQDVNASVLIRRLIRKELKR